MSDPQLSAGICMRLTEASRTEIGQLGPGSTVQVLSVRKVTATTTTTSIDRYRLILSDGVHYVHAMLATQFNDLVTRGDIVKHTVMVVDKFTCIFVQDKRFIVVLGLHVVCISEGRIGAPTVIPSSSTTSANHATEIMSDPQLSAGICIRLTEASQTEIDQLGTGFTVQVLSIRKVIPTTTTTPIDRYRLVLSDGVHFIQAMLMAQFNDLVMRGDIVKHTVVVVDKFTCYFVQDKRLIVILDLHVVCLPEGRIGAPTIIPSSSSTTSANHATEIMSDPQLSAGICIRLTEASQTEIDQLSTGFTVQVLSIRKVTMTTATMPIDRYCLILSDGVHFIHAALMKQFNDLVTRGDIVKHTVIVVDKFTCIFVQDKRFIVILGLRVVCMSEGRIGAPTIIPSSSTTSANPSTETMSDPQLSEGICMRLTEASQMEIGQLSIGFTVQVLSVKKAISMVTGTPIDRYRITLSDGVHSIQAMLATQFNDLVMRGDIVKFTVLAVDKFARGFVQDERLIIILDLHVVCLPEGGIGAPTIIPSSSSTTSANPIAETMSDPQLSEGICMHLASASETEIGELNTGFTAQILSVKKAISMVTGTPIDRYCVTLSDGVHSIQAMLATQFNDLVMRGDIVKFTVVAIDKFARGFVQDERLIIILDLRVVCLPKGGIGALTIIPSSSSTTSVNP